MFVCGRQLSAAEGLEGKPLTFCWSSPAVTTGEIQHAKMGGGNVTEQPVPVGLSRLNLPSWCHRGREREGAGGGAVVHLRVLGLRIGGTRLRAFFL